MSSPLIQKIGLVARTLPYLRWEQVVYRPIRWLQFRAYRHAPFLTKYWTAVDKVIPELPTHTLYQFRQVFESQFAHLSMPLRDIDELIVSLKQARFTYLNQTLDLPNPDWNHRYVGHLWNYQFHYQDYVVWLARAAAERSDAQAWQRCRQLIESWMSQARPGQSDGWDAYPISLRVVHWMYAYALMAERETDQAFLARWRTSIFQQLDFLGLHLEKHLLANHLFKNVKALVIGGLFFAHEARGQKWLQTGLRLLKRELAEQVLPDGGHYERAPMYHAQTFADVLECRALLQALKPAVADIVPTLLLGQMAKFLTATSYADGSLALFNDSANTFDTRPQPLFETARNLGVEIAAEENYQFPQSGYYVWQSADGSEKMVVDAGEPAVSYNTAHAHCDILSFELRLHGRPFIVDSGLHGYGGDVFREYSRSTRAHNTLMVNGHEQSEVWGTFRMARRAKNIRAKVLETASAAWHLQGSYADFCASAQRVFVRDFQRLKSGAWEIRDRLSWAKAQNSSIVHSFIHLHSSVQARIESHRVHCQTLSGEVVIEIFGADEIELVTGVMTPQVQGWYFPGFGQAEPATAVILKKRDLQKMADEPCEFGYRIMPR